MTIVRFAYLCDKCDARSPEYSSWPTCRECGADVCTACLIPGTASEDEDDAATCKECREGTWEKHQVGCDWLWDAEQTCSCKKEELDENRHNLIDDILEAR